MDIQVISSPNAPKSVEPYSQAIRAGDFIFCAGQAGFELQAAAFLRAGSASKRVKYFATWRRSCKRQEVALVAW